MWGQADQQKNVMQETRIASEWEDLWEPFHSNATNKSVEQTRGFSVCPSGKRERKGREGKGKEGKGKEGKERERKGKEGEGREGKVR